MLSPKSPLKEPIDAIIFDCDGTLSTIEGIDELANHNQVGAIVQRMTQEAMGKTGMSPELYEKRLALVKPNEAQIKTLSEEYIQNRVPHIDEVIRLFNKFNKSIYIISAGLLPSVTIFGKFLSIPEDHIFAVAVQFDQDGQYLNFDHTSPMTRKNGKRDIVAQLKLRHPHLAYVGDGLSDLEVYDLVTRFIGYGGAYYRKNIEDSCEFYIKSLSIAPLISYVLTEKEMEQLTAKERKIFSLT